MSASTPPTQTRIIQLAVTRALPLVLAASTFQAAAAASQAVLQGVVTDEVTGVGIAAATVTLVATGLATRTTADGVFSFSAVPYGHLSVRAQAAGYPAVVEEIDVGPNA